MGNPKFSNAFFQRKDCSNRKNEENKSVLELNFLSNSNCATLTLTLTFDFSPSPETSGQASPTRNLWSGCWWHCLWQLRWFSSHEDRWRSLMGSFANLKYDQFDQLQSLLTHLSTCWKALWHFRQNSYEKITFWFQNLKAPAAPQLYKLSVLKSTPL